MLEDIAILTAGTMVSADLGIKLENVTINMLGRAKKVMIEKENTTIEQYVDGLCQPLRSGWSCWGRSQGHCRLSSTQGNGNKAMQKSSSHPSQSKELLQRWRNNKSAKLFLKEYRGGGGGRGFGSLFTYKLYIYVHR